MRIWREELSFEYASYRFGYHINAIPEGERTSEMYAGGFLPASNADSAPCQFYMARSLRIPLPLFRFSSENKRVHQKFALSRRIVAAADFDFGAPVFRDIALSYMNDVLHLSGKDKLLSVLRSGMSSHVVTYVDAAGAPQGYVILVKEGGMTHYWFSFFVADLVKKSFGIWMILQEIMAAKHEGLSYLYLGTCYGQKGRYKLNFTPLEFWDGARWVGDDKALKELIRRE